MARYFLGWAMAVAFVLLGSMAHPHASAADGEPRGAYGGTLPQSDVTAPVSPSGEATLEGKVRSVDTENGRLVLDLLPPAAVKHPGQARQPPIGNPAEVTQIPKGRVTVHGTPQQLEGLTVGQQAKLPTVQYEAEVWLAPGYAPKALRGTAEREGQEVKAGGTHVIQGRIVGIDTPRGELSVAKRHGGTVSLRSHPSNLLDLRPGEFVNVTTRAFGDTHWAESVQRATSQAPAATDRPDASTPQGTRELTPP